MCILHATQLFYAVLACLVICGVHFREYDFNHKVLDSGTLGVR